jgi:hypothetical protein
MAKVPNLSLGNNEKYSFALIGFPNNAKLIVINS